MKAITLIISVIGSFAGMELASWFIHKYIMHGPLWNIHKTHHQHSEHTVELNDVFTLFFAGIATILLYVGLGNGNMFMIGSGLGITLYGLVYFILHDIFIHRRIKLFTRSKSPVIQALADAHRDHHKSINRRPSTSYGLLLIEKKYFQKYYRKRKKT